MWGDGPSWVGVYCLHCAGLWLAPVPPAGVPVDAGPGSIQQVRAEVTGWLEGRQHSVLFSLRSHREG